MMECPYYRDHKDNLWIDVEDRCPDVYLVDGLAGYFSSDVLITDGKNVLISHAHTFDKKRIGFGPMNATHWMPLPIMPRVSK